MKTTDGRKIVDRLLSEQGFDRQEKRWVMRSADVRWVIELDRPPVVGRRPRLDLEFGITFDTEGPEMRPNCLPIYGSAAQVTIGDPREFRYCLMLDQPCTDEERSSAITVGVGEFAAFVRGHLTRASIADAYRDRTFRSLFVDREYRALLPGRPAMSARLEVPWLSDLNGLSVDVVPADEPGVVSVTAWADDGSVVTLTWDEVAAAVHVRWTEADTERLVLERETASKVSVRDEHGRIEFWVWSDSADLAGQLIVRVGRHVDVSDALLRR